MEDLSQLQLKKDSKLIERMSWVISLLVVLPLFVCLRKVSWSLMRICLIMGEHQLRLWSGWVWELGGVQGSLLRRLESDDGIMKGVEGSYVRVGY